MSAHFNAKTHCEVDHFWTMFKTKSLQSIWFRRENEFFKSQKHAIFWAKLVHSNTDYNIRIGYIYEISKNQRWYGVTEAKSQWIAWERCVELQCYCLHHTTESTWKKWCREAKRMKKVKEEDNETQREGEMAFLSLFYYTANILVISLIRILLS